MKLLFTVLLLSVTITSCSSSQKKQMSPEERKANIYYGQGTRNLVDKEYTKALKNLLEANSLKNDDTKIHTNLGMAYYFKNNDRLALKHLKYALELDPKNTDAMLNMATIYMEANKLRLAEKQFNRVLEDLVYEKQFRTYFNLGVLELRRKNLSKAVKHFNSSIDINENYCPSYFQLGKIYYNRGIYKKSLKMFKESSLGTCFNNPEPHYMQALSLIKLGKYGAAKLKLEQMTEKFAMTKYEAMARRAIVKVNELSKKEYQDQMKAQSYQRKILTPDF